MKQEQLKLDLLDSTDELSEQDNQVDIDCEDDSVDNLIYKKKLRGLVQEIATFEGIEGVQISQDGRERIQQNSRYLISILVFEIVEELKKTRRKKINSNDVDKALDKVLNKVSSIDNAIMMLKNDISKLEQIKNNSVANKVSRFINNI